MSDAASRERRAVAAAAWRSLFDFIVATADERNRVLAGLGLTPNDSRALSTLDATRGRTMRSLADAWRCDASTATWIVDRLARRGLVRRETDPRDRRVTLVRLSPRGASARERLLEGIYEPPPQLLDLDLGDLEAIRNAAAALPTGQTTVAPRARSDATRPKRPRRSSA